MSVEKYIVTHEPSGFTTLPNIVLQKLSNLEALGLWCNLASRPPKWSFYKDQIRQQFNIGRDKLDKLLSILKSHNLVQIKADRGENGQFSQWNLHVKNGSEFRVPTVDEANEDGALNHNTKNQYSGCNSPEYGKPGTGFSTAINKREKNKRLKTKDNILRVKKIKVVDKCKTPRSKPRTEAPEDFNPTQHHVQLSDELGLNVEKEVPNFIDYHASKGNKFSNWNAAFNNWLRKAAEFKNESKKKQGVSASEFFRDEIDAEYGKKGLIYEAASNEVWD